jgi:sugar phosphate permease
MGWFSDKLQMRKFPMILFAIILGLVLSALIYMPHLNYYKLLTIFFGIGFFCSAHTIAYSHIAESNSQSNIGTAEALASTLMLAGGLAQAPFAWILNSHWSGKTINGVSIYTETDFHRAILMVILAIFGAALIAFTLKGNYGSRISFK